MRLMVRKATNCLRDAAPTSVRLAISAGKFSLQCVSLDNANLANGAAAKAEAMASNKQWRGSVRMQKRETP